MSRKIHDIPLSEIYADEDFNCRGNINANSVSDLAADLLHKGMLQPITVEEYTIEDKPQIKWRILMGHRRFKAAEVLQASDETILESPVGTVPCMIKNGLTELQKLSMNFNENTQRKELDLKQEAKAIEKFKLQGLSRNEIASEINMSGGWVQIRLYFSSFPENVQDALVQHNVKQAEIREFYKTLQDCPRLASGGINLDPFLNQVRAYKETGSIKSGKSKKRTASEKRLRTKSELNAFIKHIRDSGMGCNIVTRALAWASGEVDEATLDKELEEWADDYGFQYERLHETGD